jgi:hypothetical protein
MVDHRSSTMCSLPPRQGWQRHQDGFDISAGHKAKDGSTVIEQVEFGITPPPLKLMGAVDFWWQGRQSYREPAVSVLPP